MIRFPAEAKLVFSLHNFQNVSGAHPTSYPKGTSVSIPKGEGVKRARRETNHSPPTGAWGTRGAAHPFPPYDYV
jgi:hypothetical protein